MTEDARRAGDTDWDQLIEGMALDLEKWTNVSGETNKLIMEDFAERIRRFIEVEFQSIQCVS